MRYVNHNVLSAVVELDQSGPSNPCQRDGWRYCPANEQSVDGVA